MRAVRVVALAPPFHDHPRLVQRIEEFAVEQLIPQFCSVIPSLRQASTTASPLPNSISMVRNCPMISSAVYRLRAMPAPFAGRNLNFRSGLVYRGLVSGFISEVDVLRALEAGKDLFKWQAEDLMIHDRIAVTAETTIEEAVKMMEEKRLLNPPVTQNGGWPTR
jgi:CBS domain-containing protein